MRGGFRLDPADADSNARLFHQFHRGPGEPQVPPLGLKPRVGMTAFHFERAQLHLRRHDFLYISSPRRIFVSAREHLSSLRDSYNFRLNPALRHPTPIRAKAARLGDPGSAACWAKLFRAYGAGFQPVVPGGDRRGARSPLPVWNFSCHAATSARRGICCLYRSVENITAPSNCRSVRLRSRRPANSAGRNSWRPIRSG